MLTLNQAITIDTHTELKDHENVAHKLSTMMGKNGILLGFTMDVWNVSSVRYVLWLQRQKFKLAALDISCALIIPNQPYELNGFHSSIPRKIRFPLLADPKRAIVDAIPMEAAGYALLTPDGELSGRWFVGETSSISLRTILVGKGILPKNGLIPRSMTR